MQNSDAQFGQDNLHDLYHKKLIYINNGLGYLQRPDFGHFVCQDFGNCSKSGASRNPMMNSCL